MTPTDRMFGAARDTADVVARRAMERDLAWAEHLRDALLVIEDEDDDPDDPPTLLDGWHGQETP